MKERIDTGNAIAEGKSIIQSLNQTLTRFDGFFGGDDDDHAREDMIAAEGFMHGLDDDLAFESDSVADNVLRVCQCIALLSERVEERVVLLHLIDDDTREVIERSHDYLRRMEFDPLFYEDLAS